MRKKGRMPLTTVTTEGNDDDEEYKREIEF